MKMIAITGITSLKNSSINKQQNNQVNTSFKGRYGKNEFMKDMGDAAFDLMARKQARRKEISQDTLDFYNKLTTGESSKVKDKLINSFAKLMKELPDGDAKFGVSETLNKLKLLKK